MRHLEELCYWTTDRDGEVVEEVVDGKEVVGEQAFRIQ